MIADAVLVFHALFVLFVIGGFVLVLVGARRWGWVRNRTLRVLHLAAMTFVTAEALLGVTCPLTIWEDTLRGGVSERSFIGRWVARLLYYDFPEWAFATAYCVFTLAVVCAWWIVPPRARQDKAL